MPVLARIWYQVYGREVIYVQRHSPFVQNFESNLIHFDPQTFSTCCLVLHCGYPVKEKENGYFVNTRTLHFDCHKKRAISNCLHISEMCMTIHCPAEWHEERQDIQMNLQN